MGKIDHLELLIYDVPAELSNYENELLKNYNKQYFIKEDSTIEKLASAMCTTEVIDFSGRYSTSPRYGGYFKRANHKIIAQKNDRHI